MLLAKMDEFGKPAWLIATLLAFWLFWPLGFAVLAYLAWSGRLYSVSAEGPGRWLTPRPGAFGARADASPSGNRAFDEYRADTLKRLEEEQREFVAYLDRLRRARDKAEFDQFMAERRKRSEAPDQDTDA